MNNRRRERLRDAVMALAQVKYDISSVKDDELDSVSSYPENLQGSCRHNILEEAVDNLEDAIESLDDATEYIIASMAKVR